MNDLKLYDTVALTKDMPEKKLRKGSIGTIVEILEGHSYLVEFSNLKGVMYAMPVVDQDQLMKLYHEPVLA